MDDKQLLKIEPKKTMVETVAQKLIDYISSNGLKEGAQLPSERELVDIIGISRLPLREALCMLKGLGILEARHGKGVFVKAIDMSTVFSMLSPLLKTHASVNLDSIIQTRLYLEADIAELAARNRTKENLENLRRSLEGMKKSLSDKTDFIKHDIRFHSELAKSTQNKILHILMCSVVDLMAEVQFKYPDAVPRRKTSLEYHAQILQALKSKNKQLARKSIQEHIFSIGKAISGTSA
jgi:GntR family transcriptional repressor for pyruvate dehydrogenase complex